LPALAPLPSENRDALHAAMRSRWSRIVAAAIAFLLVSGLYNFMMIAVQYRVPRWYHPVFGVKFLAAFAIFAIASLLAGKTPAAEALRRNTKAWMNLNIVLAVLVVCLSGVLRSAEKIPKAEPPATTPSSQTGG
jgi:putative copper export protein